MFESPTRATTEPGASRRASAPRGRRFPPRRPPRSRCPPCRRRRRRWPRRSSRPCPRCQPPVASGAIPECHSSQRKSGRERGLNKCWSAISKASLWISTQAANHSLKLYKKYHINVGFAPYLIHSLEDGCCDLGVGERLGADALHQPLRASRNPGREGGHHLKMTATKCWDYFEPHRLCQFFASDM